MNNEIRDQVRRITIYTKRIMQSSLSGDYLSAFKGTGLEFDKLREYQMGDDVRFIDWNSSAKTNKIMVKQFVEERDRTVILAVDISASTHYSSNDELRSQTIAQVSAALAFIATHNKDKLVEIKGILKNLDVEIISALDFPEMPEFASVRIADFIADSLKIAGELSFDKVIVACMAGKLYKYAAALKYTHAHTVRYGCQDLAAIAGNLGVDDEMVRRCRQSASVREAFSYLSPKEVTLMQDHLGCKALEELQKWAGKVALELRLYDPQGNFLQGWSTQ